jgi:hypothetical protein
MVQLYQVNKEGKQTSMDELHKYRKVSIAALELGYKNRSTLHYHIQKGNIKAVFSPNIGEWLIHKDDLLAFRYSKHYGNRESESDETS